MPEPIDVYVFPQDQFEAAAQPIVCIANRAAIERYLTQREISRAFSGHAIYCRGQGCLLPALVSLFWPGGTYIGVWGSRNASRFRRFLRERGAELVIHNEAPAGVHLTQWTTKGERRRVRSIPRRRF